MRDDEIPFGEPLPVFEIVDAEAFAAVDEPGADPLVTHDDMPVIPVDGFVLVWGDAGGGKTTMCVDWSVHFASGEPWLQLLAPRRPLTILLVENEGPRPEFRRKLRRRLEAWSPSLEGRLRVLSEPWASLSLREPDHRAALAAKLTGVDPRHCRPLSALGTEGGGTLDEIHEFETFMRATRELVEGPLSFVLVHHPNRAGQVSGAWERAPDTLIHVQDEGHGRTRVYWQKVKWCSALHKTTTHLVWADGDSFTVEEREEITEDTMADEMLAAVRENGGASWSKIRPNIRGNDGEKADVRDQLIRGGQLLNTAPRQGHFRLWVSDDPAAPRAELSTAPARAGATSPERESEAVRATVPYVSRHGAQHGTDDRGFDGARNHRWPRVRASTTVECLICECPYEADADGAESMTCPACVAERRGLVTPSEAGEMRLLTRLSLTDEAA